MSLISDGLFLEATAAHAPARAGRLSAADWKTPTVGALEQARAIAKWIHDSGQDDDKTAHFPGLAWLRQPVGYSNREWIVQLLVVLVVGEVRRLDPEEVGERGHGGRGRVGAVAGT